MHGHKHDQQKAPQLSKNGPPDTFGMARLPKGVPPTPHKIRQRGYRNDLKSRGGRRVNADLEVDAAEALRSIEEATGKTAKEAITAALIAYAVALPGKPPAS